jgi:dUTP pyrophosphatase
VQIKVLDYARSVYGEELERGFSPKHGGDAGIDLRAAERVSVERGETVAVALGVAMAVPRDHVGWITGRSTTVLKMGLLVHEGKIDSGYRGEVHCFCTAMKQAVIVEKGDRLCQLVCLKLSTDIGGWRTVEELDRHFDERGLAGLGSTGIR